MTREIADQLRRIMEAVRSRGLPAVEKGIAAKIDAAKDRERSDTAITP